MKIPAGGLSARAALEFFRVRTEALQFGQQFSRRSQGMRINAAKEILEALTPDALVLTADIPNVGEQAGTILDAARAEMERRSRQ